jgi:hypothetical protein
MINLCVSPEWFIGIWVSIFTVVIGIVFGYSVWINTAAVKNIAKKSALEAIKNIRIELKEETWATGNYAIAKLLDPKNDKERVLKYAEAALTGYKKANNKYMISECENLIKRIKNNLDIE